MPFTRHEPWRLTKMIIWPMNMEVAEGQAIRIWELGVPSRADVKSQEHLLCNINGQVSILFQDGICDARILLCPENERLDKVLPQLAP